MGSQSESPIERGKMDEADFKNAVAIVKTGAEAGVPFGEIEVTFARRCQ